MQTLTINSINPKAEKLINDLVELKLISIEENIHYSKEHLDMLDKEYNDHQNGIGKNYTKEEFYKALKKKKLA